MSNLTFAIPSKGRLKENAENWLASCGFKVRQLGGSRGYRAELKGIADVDMMLLSAREIAQGLIAGELHIGVTGEDLLHDLSHNLAQDAAIIKPLGFGHANVVVAVPAAWLDVDTMTELEAAGAAFRVRHGRRLRVATKYLNITRRYFAEKSVGEYRLVESAGATEAAPASGSADVIVDITSTGATLKANGLKILQDGTMLRSQAALAGSLRANWSDQALSSLKTLLGNVAAREQAETYMSLKAAKPIPEKLIDSHKLTSMGPNEVHVENVFALNVAQQITSAGAGPVEIQQARYIFHISNTFFDRFCQILGSCG